MSRRHESRSAESVAFLRALYSLPESSPQLNDHLAARFLASPLWRLGFRLAAGSRICRRLLVGILRLALGDSFLYIPLRTRFIDEAVLHAAGGQHQLLILGAGYDTRSFRMGTDFRLCVEIDLSETQVRKQRILADSALTAGQRVRLLPADLRRSDWTEQLVETGLCPDLPTLVVAEGLIGYLSREETESLFTALAAFFRPDARQHILFTYPTATAGQSPFVRLLQHLFRRSRERFAGAWTPGELTTMLARSGFRLNQDLSFRDLFRRFTDNQEPRERWSLPFRLAVAGPVVKQEVRGS